MYYEINVSKNGLHYFATDKRSLGTQHDAIQMYCRFRKIFPKEDGYEISVTKWEIVGEPIELDAMYDSIVNQ